MRIGDYAWNKHEQEMKLKQKNFNPSMPKIKIIDNEKMRIEIEEKLEEFPQKILARWALRVSSNYLNMLDEHLIDDPRIQLGIDTLEQRIHGNIRAHDLRKVGFTVNELAKESKSDISKYAARSFAQAIATGHMRSHALVSSDYAVKVSNLLTGNSKKGASLERENQLLLIENVFLKDKYQN